MTEQQKPAVIDLVPAGRLVGLSRTATYSAASDGELIPGVPVIRVGRRKLVVPTAALERALGLDLGEYIQGAR
jgi:hypothetical protein